ncbi:MAG TPA: hypothetical protein VKV28_13275 [Candidatus Binataceae bacterium]|nr:hypothetical protein [Candidatus Binataceae bacterium]
MKKLLGALACLALLVPLSGGLAQGQSSPSPTVCPVNYQCSLLVTGNFPLEGQPTDGHPSSIVGFLSFDANSNITGIVSINENGHTATNISLTGDNAKCTSGSATTLGTLTATVTLPNTSTTFTLTYDFVTATTTAGQELMLSGETTTSPADTPVSVGICKPSAVA